MMEMQTTVIPEPVTIGMQEIRRLQSLWEKYPILAYMPPLEFPVKYADSQMYTNALDIRYWFEGGANAEVYVVRNGCKTPWQLNFLAAHWPDEIFGLPPRQNRLLIQIRSHEIRQFFLLDELRHLKLSGNMDDLARLNRCAENVSKILEKIKQPIIRTLERNGIMVPADDGRDKYM